MAAFKDIHGREWQVTINVGSVKRVKELLDLNLCGLVQDKCQPLDALLSDLARFVDVLFVLCKEQADRDGVTDMRFAEGLLGDPLDNAAKAFLEALEAFFPKPETRKALRRMIQLGDKLRTELALRAEVEFQKAEADPNSLADRYIASVSTSPASSASSPTPEP